MAWVYGATDMLKVIECARRTGSLMGELIERVLALLYLGVFSSNRAVRYSVRVIVVILIAGVVALVIANN